MPLKIICIATQTCQLARNELGHARALAKKTWGMPINKWLALLNPPIQKIGRLNHFMLQAVESFNVATASI